MLETLKLIATVAAIAIALVAYIPYLIDMFRGKNQPHLYTWISIVLVTTVVTIIQFAGGAGVGAIPTALGAIIDAIILLFCFRFGTKDIVLVDKICLGISIVGVVSYAFLYQQPVVSLLIVTIAEITSFVPTFRKTYRDPYSESLPSYYLIIAKLVLILAALQAYNFLTTSYSILWVAVFIVFLAMVYIRRAHTSKKSVRETETAPLI